MRTFTCRSTFLYGAMFFSSFSLWCNVISSANDEAWMVVDGDDYSSRDVGVGPFETSQNHITTGA
jgi:hypothetical protein